MGENQSRMNLGRTIREIRESKGISQLELSKKSFVDINYINGIESGEIELDVVGMLSNQIQSIAITLDVSVVVIALLSFEKSDIPEKNRDLYDSVHVPLRDSLISLMEIDPNKRLDS